MHPSRRWPASAARPRVPVLGPRHIHRLLADERTGGALLLAAALLSFL